MGKYVVCININIKTLFVQNKLKINFLYYIIQSSQNESGYTYPTVDTMWYQPHIVLKGKNKSIFKQTRTKFFSCNTGRSPYGTYQMNQDRKKLTLLRHCSPLQTQKHYALPLIRQSQDSYQPSQRLLQRQLSRLIMLVHVPNQLRLSEKAIQSDNP
ncbi:Hypothetical_protein [Hexamita inflata]|uniref:Hypothetical_protein n=1 Tax=Hexamita inflata TaxID=28002 RepID=A0AA86TSN5_9EUKA|nr:Hypothetical protein HINF_LOCUS14821 [Hexamita inflata]